jgi:hypothetical protein
MSARLRALAWSTTLGAAVFAAAAPWAVTIWLSNIYSILGMAQNLLVYLHPETRQFQLLPWDPDHSFGQFPMMVSNNGVDLSLTQAWSDVRFLDRLFGVERFSRLYLRQVHEFSGTLFRLTVDSGLEVCRVPRSGGVWARPLRLSTAIVEVEYAPADADGADEVANRIPLRLT